MTTDPFSLDPIALVREHVHGILQSAECRTAAADRDPRPIHRLLGAQQLLAPHWPARYGGRDLPFSSMPAVVEELALHDVPELLHTLSIQTVGTLLFLNGSEQMKERVLPALASGEAFACVLFSETTAGSDLSLITTTATPIDGGRWLISGRKEHSLFTPLATFGLCLARTPDDSFSLFLLPMDREGIHVEEIQALQDDPFHSTTLNNVIAEPEDVVGQPGTGWALIMSTLVYERTGSDYLSKAESWFQATLARWNADTVVQDRDSQITLARLRVRLDVAASLVARVLYRLENGNLGEDEAAAAKWYTSKLAVDVAWVAQELASQRGTLDPAIDAAWREAPGMLISGGTSEMMLETIARFRLDGRRQVMP